MHGPPNTVIGVGLSTYGHNVDSVDDNVAISATTSVVIGRTRTSGGAVAASAAEAQTGDEA